MNWIIEEGNNHIQTNAVYKLTHKQIYYVEARDGDASEVDLAYGWFWLIHTGGTATELRRPSILRSGNHTFEYVGFGLVTILLVYLQFRTEFLLMLKHC